MSEGPIRQQSESWWAWLLIVAVLEAGWLGALIPPAPSTFLQWLLAIATGLFIIACGYGGFRVYFWLLKFTSGKMLANTLFVIVAVGLLAAMIAAAYLCGAFIRGELPFVH